MSNRSRILVITAYYLPGYKAGGPLRTIVNMVNLLSDEFEFWIVAHDRDLGDASPFCNVRPNEWQRVGKAMVHYLSPEMSTLKNLAKLISTTPHDLLYLNSFFDLFSSIRPLLARRLGLLPDKPVVLAPRGEFSAGALRLKHVKKNLYIKSAKLLGLHNNVFWQASSDFEGQDISRIVGPGQEHIHIAMDLPCLTDGMINADPEDNDTTAGNPFLRVVFLSRISAKKNLDYALRSLKKTKCKIKFDIYGPVEDEGYWHQCQEVVKDLPDNVAVTYCGSVSPDHVKSVFAKYDLFFFPTHGENYGHVIAESLSVGTPVLLSDQTPWRNLASDGMGWDLPLDDMDKFTDAIDEFAMLPAFYRQSTRELIRSKANKRLSDPDTVEANRILFRKCINS